MTYVVRPSYGPHFKIGDLVDFEAKVPELKRRVELVNIYKNGRVRGRPLETLLDPREAPEHLKLERKPPSLRDIFESENGVMIVSQPLRDLLERLDPGLHQFLPITLDGRPEFGARFILNVHQTQDSIVDEQSDVTRHAEMPDNRDVMFIKYLKPGLTITVDSSRLGGANLWRERRYPGSLLVSDELLKELKRNKLKFFPLIKACEI